MPLHLPYLTNSTGYEQAEGEIQLNGNYYLYVKRKVSNDTLYVQCLRNSTKTALYKARNIYGQQANDPYGEKANNPSVKKFHINYEYNQPVAGFTINKIVFGASYAFAGRHFDLADPFISAPYHPPRV